MTATDRVVLRHGQMDFDYTAEATRIMRALLCAGVSDDVWAMRYAKHPEWQATIHEVAYQLLSQFERGKRCAAQ